MPIYRLLAAIFGLTVSGCGTVMNVRDLYVNDPSNGTQQSIFRQGLNPAPKEIYGGVLLDAASGEGWLEEGRPLMAGYVWLVDLPLSVVGDTLTLPITIRHSFKNSESENSLIPPYHIVLE